MRGRILLAMLFGLAALVACSKKDSLYIDPGKANPEPARSGPATPSGAAANTLPSNAAPAPRQSP
jgi:hypothetical protein